MTPERFLLAPSSELQLPCPMTFRASTSKARIGSRRPLGRVLWGLLAGF